MTERERNTDAVMSITNLINKAHVDMDPIEFIAVYAANKGIKAQPVNVWTNIRKYELDLPGNYKYLYRVLADANFINNLGDSIKR